MSNIIFEVCAGSYEDCIAAQNGGANRVELNSALYLGGLTPSLGTVALVKRDIQIPIAAMVRPRAGGFNYSENEYEVMKEDARALINLGVEGIVFGFLDEQFRINQARTKEFVTLIHSLGAEAIVHRAFDLVSDVDEAMESLIECGVDRVLTSGLATQATKGTKVLAYLQSTYGSKIEILAGVGLRDDNVKQLIEETGVRQVHSSCKMWKEDITAVHRDISYGFDFNHEKEYEYVDENKVYAFSNITKNI